MTIEDYFPHLRELGHRVTSAATGDYNCIAWAAGRDDEWWLPDPMGSDYWPPGAPRAETIAAFIFAFEGLGYVRCESDTIEPGVQKVALYAHANMPTHAARQLPDGTWTSKLGALEDIVHTLNGLTGAVYGQVVQILKRSI